MSPNLPNRHCCPRKWEAYATPMMAATVSPDRFDDCRWYCYDPDFDLNLVARLVEVMGVKANCSLAAQLSARFGASSCDIEGGVKLILRTLRLLHLSGYPKQDIELMMVHASSYLESLMKTTMNLQSMQITEIAHIVVLLLYLAQAWIEDEALPLSAWHKHLFKNYCNLATLDEALMVLLERVTYTLRIPDNRLNARLTFLQKERKEHTNDIGVSVEGLKS
eukprot:GEMP01078956.1.p1 GENE.GEMP01078956.1~~GEMP01078956.1.p1  ORF type:complete len:221 (+),score=49.35 GEMP01078956.1:294-956(+)